MSPATLNPADQALTVRLRRAGIVYPLITLQESRAARLDLPVLCAVLEQETGGGHNIFGHDPTIFTGAGAVTKEKYLAYREQRGPSGHGGMQGVGPMQLCVDPDTPVLTTDLQWVPADAAVAGTEIVAFDEHGIREGSHPKNARRHFRTATVEAMQIARMERLRVVTSCGDVIVTPGHPFLTWRPERHTWRRAVSLRPGDEIISLPLWSMDHTRRGGYVAGQFDGEGCFTVGQREGQNAFARVLWSQAADSPDVPFMWETLETLGFRPGWHKAPARGWNGQRNERGKPVAHVTIAGGWPEMMRFVGSIRPRRFLRHPRLRELWERRQLNSCVHAVVEGTEQLADGPMVAHQTSTATLIAGGLLSHNTWYAFQDMADSFGGCWQPRFNIRVGAQHLAEEIGHSGLHVALRNYNGSDAYAVQVQNRLPKWHAVVAG